MFSRGGRTYLAEASGIRPAHLGGCAAQQRHLAWSCCPATTEAVCAPEVVDLTTGASRRLAPIPNPYEMGISVLLSDDGDIAIVHLSGERADAAALRRRWSPRRTASTTCQHRASRAGCRAGWVWWLPRATAAASCGSPSIDGGVLVEPIGAFDGLLGDFLYVIPR